MIYLSTPYTHPDPDVMEERFRAACRVAWRLMNEGMVVYSPIAHNHTIVSISGVLPWGWDFWEKFDRHMIALSEKVVIVMIDGWKDSKGIKAEFDIAQELGKPVEFIDEN